MYGVLGELVDGCTVDQALEQAEMTEWNVRKIAHRQIVAKAGGGYTEVAVPDVFTVLRDNPTTKEPEALGSVGRKWTPFSNEAVGDVCKHVQEMAGATPFAMGVTQGGRKTFIAMKMAEGFNFRSPRTGLIDTTELFMVFNNDFAGYGSLTANLTPQRMACCNMQRAAEARAKSRFALKHTGDEEARMQQLRQLLDESWTFHGEYKLACEAQIARELDEDQVLRELGILLRLNDPDATDRQREIRQQSVDNMFSIYQNEETVQPFAGTAFGVYQAITYYTDHVMGVRVPDGATAADVTVARANRTMNSWQLDDLKQRAFEQLVPAELALTN
jgi:phage/plasmid-like protein (TIGR03299 family)